MSKVKVDIFFDKEKQKLYMKIPKVDLSEFEFVEIYVLGMGVPAQLMFGEPTPTKQDKDR